MARLIFYITLLMVAVCVNGYDDHNGQFQRSKRMDKHFAEEDNVIDDDMPISKHGHKYEKTFQDSKTSVYPKKHNRGKYEPEEMPLHEKDPLHKQVLEKPKSKKHRKQIKESDDLHLQDLSYKSSDISRKTDDDTNVEKMDKNMFRKTSHKDKKQKKRNYNKHTTKNFKKTKKDQAKNHKTES